MSEKRAVHGVKIISSGRWNASSEPKSVTECNHIARKLGKNPRDQNELVFMC